MCYDAIVKDRKQKQAEYARAHYERNKEAMKARAKLHRQAKADLLRNEIVRAKDVPCADCGIKYITPVMEFDHIDDNKDFTISPSVGRGIAVATLLAEIAKCEVVCANCHRIRTHNRRLAQAQGAAVTHND